MSSWYYMFPAKGLNRFPEGRFGRWLKGRISIGVIERKSIALCLFFCQICYCSKGRERSIYVGPFGFKPVWISIVLFPGQ